MALSLSFLLRSARPAAAPLRLAATALPLSQALPLLPRPFSTDAVGDEVLALNKELLGTISRMDFEAYAGYMSDDISCFEPEAAHQQGKCRATPTIS